MQQINNCADRHDDGTHGTEVRRDRRNCGQQQKKPAVDGETRHSNNNKHEEERCANDGGKLDRIRIEPHQVRLFLEPVAYAFYRLNVVDADLFANLSDMHINGTINDKHVRTPDLVKQFVTGKDSPRVAGKKIE